CPRGSRRQGASRRRPVLARLGQKCGAVDQPATLEGNPRQSLSRLPQQQTSAPPAATRAMLTHNLRLKKRQTQQRKSAPTAVFRFRCVHYPALAKVLTHSWAVVVSRSWPATDERRLSYESLFPICPGAPEIENRGDSE